MQQFVFFILTFRASVAINANYRNSLRSIAKSLRPLRLKFSN